MRFLSMIRIDEKTGKQPSEQLMQDMGKLMEELTRSGQLVSTAGLRPTAEGFRVRLRNGKVTTNDGPFTETKEVIGGYAVLEAKSKEEAVELTKRFLHVHGDEWDLECEVRPQTDRELARGCPGIQTRRQCHLSEIDIQQILQHTAPLETHNVSDNPAGRASCERNRSATESGRGQSRASTRHSSRLTFRPKSRTASGLSPLRREGWREVLAEGSESVPLIALSAARLAVQHARIIRCRSLIWGDYRKPGTPFTSTPFALCTERPRISRIWRRPELEVETESELDSQTMHGVWFNRGAVGARRTRPSTETSPRPNPRLPSIPRPNGSRAC